MEIKKITKATAAQAGYIYAQSWKTGYKGIVPQAYLDGLSSGQWAEKLGAGGHGCFWADYLLSDHGKFAAASSICEARDRQYQGWGEIISIYVLPEEFRKGYGRALFSYVSGQLVENGFSDIYLWVLEENIRARKFYESMGFSENGDRIVQNIGGKRLAEVRYVNL